MRRLAKALGVILSASVITLSSYGKAPNSEPELRTLTGQVYRIDRNELIYKDKRLERDAGKISIPVNIFEIKSEEVGYKLLLAGPDSTEVLDFVEVKYLPDKNVTAREIWNWYNPEMANSRRIRKPDREFEGDGLILKIRRILSWDPLYNPQQKKRRHEKKEHYRDDQYLPRFTDSQDFAMR